MNDLQVVLKVAEFLWSVFRVDPPEVVLKHFLLLPLNLGFAHLVRPGWTLRYVQYRSRLVDIFHPHLQLSLEEGRRREGRNGRRGEGIREGADISLLQGLG